MPETEKGRESLFNSLYSYAVHHIWSSGKFKKRSIVLWIMGGLGILLKIIHLDQGISSNQTWVACNMVILIAGSITIAELAWYAHGAGISSDPAIRYTPIHFRTLFSARALAVVNSWWIMFFLFVIFLAVTEWDIAHAKFLSGSTIDLSCAANRLFMFSDNGEWYVRRMGLPPSQFAVTYIYSLGIIHAVTLITIPLMWGFWMASKYPGNRTTYMTLFYSWFILPMFLFLWFDFGILKLGYGVPGRIWSLVTVSCAFTVLLTFLLYILARREWESRG
ncbi:MAG TPA: hypothetical protein VGB30_05670 [bacterium]|jgi:hypothetical protein